MDVFSSSQSTENWFAKYLLNDTDDFEDDENVSTEVSESQAPWWAQGREQSDLGVLLLVEGHASASSFGLGVREILMYAGVSSKSREAQDPLLTPPRSSSPHGSETPVTSEEGIPRTVQIYAKLLYSGFPWSRDAEISLPAASGYNTEEAQFLTPPRLEPTVINHVEQHNTKRRTVDALFEEAARENKRSRKRGGGNVAHMMAKSDHPSPALFPHGFKEMIPTKEESNAIDSQAGIEPSAFKKRSHLSRSKSISSLRDLGESRPSSRHSNPAINDIQKRSSLHRLSSMNNQDHVPSPSTEAMSTIETQNRNALTRVVMAGLRLYGLQPKKKSLPNLPNQSSLSTDHDEEYKQLYHQTFKAAAFTFRKQIAVECISQPALREVVDKLLGLFCVDPLAESQLNETFTQSSLHDNG